MEQRTPSGKSRLGKMMLEALLDAGKRVVVASPAGLTSQKRYGKLTCITSLSPPDKLYGNKVAKVIYDDTE